MMIIPSIVVKVEGEVSWNDLKNAISFLIIGYILAELHTNAFLRVNDQP
jgi:hypothetical protein